MGSLKWAFNELKLLKVQFRPLVSNNRKQMKRIVRAELLLGDIHSRKNRREFYSPTIFQEPLIKWSKGENITIDDYQLIIKNSVTVSNSLIKSKIPPHLMEKPHLPPMIWGEWTSTRCEIRPMDVYLLRRFVFNEKDSSWVGEHKFFADPFCTYSKFIITASGHFEFSPSVSPMLGVTNIDFKIERATITALDLSVVADMRLQNFCGIGVYIIGQPKELGPTNGCMCLGLVIPSEQLDIVKIEMDYEGAMLLFLGQVDTDNKTLNEDERPTAFQLPMVKCGEQAVYSENLIETLEKRLHFNNSIRRTWTVNSLFATILLLLILR